MGKDINDIDALVNITNKAQKKNEVNQAADVFSEKIKSDNNAPKKARRKNNNGIKKTIAAITAASMIAGAGGAIASNIATKNQSKKEKVEALTNSLIELAEDNLVENNLGKIVDGEFEIGKNEVSDYYVLDADDPMEIFIYGLAIMDSTEIDNLIQSATYDNGAYHYIDRNQFFSVNGYIDPEKDRPSAEVFCNMMEAELTSAVENMDVNTISSYADEFYSTDLTQNNKTR